MIKLTVILPTYNRGELLISTLDSLVAQDLERSLWEVVVVNNNSTDRTLELLQSYTEAHGDQLNIRVVTEIAQGLSHARNRGIREAQGDIFVFIDDDELINREFLSNYYNFFDSHPGVAVAGGRIVAHFEHQKPCWVTKYTEMTIAGVLNYGDQVREFTGSARPNGGNMAIRRQAIDHYGAYDVNLGRTGNSLLGGEERELVNRFRKGSERIFYVPDAIVYHCVPEQRWSIDYLRKVSYMIGVSERRRTLNEGRSAYLKRCLSEIVKWGGVCALTVGYTLQGAPSKGWSLVTMRRQITKGLLGF